MVELRIEKKIVDEQLLNGEKININFLTDFNGKGISKIFPDDFSPEQQEVFKQVYELAVYGSEVGNNIFKCSNNGNVISISGYTRTEPTELGIVDFDSTQELVLKFTRHGKSDRSEIINTNFGQEFSQPEIDQLASLGITLQGISSEFEVADFDGDISMEVLKAETDSFIDLGSFDNGKILFTK